MGLVKWPPHGTEYGIAYAGAAKSVKPTGHVAPTCPGSASTALALTPSYNADVTAGAALHFAVHGKNFQSQACCCHRHLQLVLPS